MRCPYCGQPNSDNAHNCKRCGKRLDSVREKRKEKNILLYGIILIALILAAGIGAMFAISRYLKSPAPAPRVDESKVTIQSPTPTPLPTATPEATPIPEETPAETEEGPVTAMLVSDDRFGRLREEGYQPVTVSEAVASSTIWQEGVDNGPHTLYDGQDWSSWQDGVAGEGIGENITFTLDREYQVRALAVKLGNWYESEDYYYMNNRPQTMTFEIGNETVTLTFPDQRTVFYMELSRDVPASQIRFVIDSVYKGTAYDDTCINEITIYGI